MSGILPSWIERLLGIDAQRGEGTVWSLEHTWAWPPWVTLLFAVLAVVFVVTIYLREGRRASRRFRLMLAGIRLALVTLALVMIAQLTLSLQRTGLPYIAVLVDNSESMTIVDPYEEKLRAKLQQRVRQTGGGQLRRWDLAKTLLTERDGVLLGQIDKEYKLRLYFLEDSAAGVGTGHSAGVAELIETVRAMEKPVTTSSHLGAAVRTILEDLRGTTPAAVILLTDGINTGGPSLEAAAVTARRKGVPLFAVGLGSEQPARDVQLADLLVDRKVFVGDVVNFEFRLAGPGYEGQQVRIVLRRGKQRDVLTQMEVTVESGGRPQQVRLPYRPTEVGKFRFVVEVEPQEGELRTDNNRLEQTVEVSKEKIRVLLVQAYPSFEFRYLRNMLQRDETIELDTVLQNADLKYAEQDASALRVFPVSDGALASYDVIILGDANPALLTDAMMQNLVDFVDQPGRGGALVLIAGQRYMPAAYRDTPLERLMPVDLGSVRYPDPDQPITEGFQMQPTVRGLAGSAMQLGDTPDQTRSIWQNLPPLYWLLEIPKLKPAAQVLAEHPVRRDHDGQPLPVICMQYVGAGKVLFHATDETWRWRRRVGDVFFARYWVQMIRYLSRTKLSEGRSAELTVDHRDGKYRHGEPVRLRVQFADERLAPPEDDGVIVVLEHRGQKTQRIQLRRGTGGRKTFETVLSSPPVGKTHAWMAIPTLEGQAPAVDFEVTAGDEFETVEMDAPALRRAATLTKGRFYTPADADRLLKDLPPGYQVPIESLPPESLWDKWPVLLLFLMLLIAEWVLRKVGGLV